MYLSRIALNAERRTTMRALSSPQMLHGALERSYQGERQRNLWRVDWLGDSCYLLVLSEQRLDFSGLAEGFGYPDTARQGETKRYEPLLERLRPGQSWQFRLRANPVRSSSQQWDSKSGRGKVFAHVTTAQQKQWLLARAQSCGFALEESAFDVVHTEWLRFHKGSSSSREVTLRAVTFEGVLTITDIECFSRALLSGIGRSKAYGCGLLTIARYEGGRDA